MATVGSEGKVYFDNNATTKVDGAVLEAMIPYFSEAYGNASAVYGSGVAARGAVEAARGKVAAAVGANPDEIAFTGCGTESDNWAIMGAARAGRGKGRHIVTTAIEHHAVLDTFKALEKEGYEATYLPVDRYGLVDPDDVRKAIRGDTTLVSVMYANNEIGTVEPIGEIGEVCARKGVTFHTDAVQAVGTLAIDLSKLPVDMLSASAHKLHGPKGVGFLYIRKGTKIDKFMHGGGQERRRRAGTENVPGIVGFGKALELAAAEIPRKGEAMRAICARIIEGVMGSVPDVILNGHPERRLPNNVNLAFRRIEGESLLLLLDMAGIEASSGSACTSGSLDPSHVLLAVGLPHEVAHGSLRVSLSKYSTMGEAEALLKVLPGIVARLRAMSPLP
ncbi:MAG: cysteine desulfurase NifS [Oscillospiraceae bacterium]|nr:cysteine desulfurase NifS [Oscillospiraceae bacterium]